MNRNGHSHIQSINTVSVVITHTGTACYNRVQKHLFLSFFKFVDM